MNKIIFLMLLLAGCAQTKTLLLEKKPEFTAPDSAKNPLKVVKREFWQIQGAEDILRDTSAATLSVWIRQTEQETHQDVLGISVGDKKLSRITSRASIRVYPQGRLFAVARAGDREAEQNIMSKPALKKDHWHHVILTIDYPKDEMRFYLDGEPLPVRGVVDFKAEKTSDTSSRSVVLGAEDDGSINHFKGDIKDVRVWRHKLSDEEIQVLAKKLKPGENLMFGM